MRLMGLAAGLVLLALAAPAGAEDVEIVMDANASGCTGYVTGLGFCKTGQSTVTVTWRLDPGPQFLSIYDLEIRWDPSELTLVSAEQLHADSSPNPGDFILEPSDPAGSRVLATTLVAESTTDLFSVTFALTPEPRDGQADLEWDVGLLGGLGPPDVVLLNPGGARIDFAPESLPSLSWGAVPLVAGLLAAGAWQARRVWSAGA